MHGPNKGHTAERRRLPPNTRYTKRIKWSMKTMEAMDVNTDRSCKAALLSRYWTDSSLFYFIFVFNKPGDPLAKLFSVLRLAGLRSGFIPKCLFLQMVVVNLSLFLSIN